MEQRESLPFSTDPIYKPRSVITNFCNFLNGETFDTAFLNGFDSLVSEKDVKYKEEREREDKRG